MVTDVGYITSKHEISVGGRRQRSCCRAVAPSPPDFARLQAASRDAATADARGRPSRRAALAGQAAAGRPSREAPPEAARGATHRGAMMRFVT